MNQTRSFLLIAWLVVAALLWLQWNQPPATAPATAAAANGAPVPTTQTPATLPGALPSTLPTAAPGAPAIATTTAAGSTARTITLENDVLRLTIDLDGGQLVGSQLLQYTVEKKAGSPDVELLSSEPARYYTAGAGLIVLDGQQRERVLDERFQSEGQGNRFALAPGAAQISVPLTWTDPATGMTVRRTLTLTRDSYALGMSEQISNNGAARQALYPFVDLHRVAPPAPPKHSFLTNPDSFSVVGPAWYSPEEKYERTRFTAFDSKKPPASDVSGGWIAMLQHHFVVAWLPDAHTPQRFATYTQSHDGSPLYVIRSVAAPQPLLPGTSQTRESRLWVGPKLQGPLAQLAPGLEKTVDYSIFAVIAQPLFWLLSWLHRLFGNWGWAIIAIVVLLKAALYPVSKKQYQSMAKMRQLQPRLEALKERYGDDRQQYQMAMMELYKKEKINPVAGCLPALIPMPIFLALYWVLVETVELRHAPWMGWIQNLTDADPYFVLPALNLLVMYLTQKLTPTPGMDPMQKKMMQFMPLVFGVMMAFFPSGLVLYWVTNGLLGLLQQWWMTKQFALAPTVSR